MIELITFQGWDAVVLCVLAAYGFVVAMVRCWLRTWAGLQRFAERRLERRIVAGLSEMRARVYRKFLRHAPSGRVGLCADAGFVKHRWLGWLRVVETVDLIVCPGCARRELEPAHPLVLMLSMPHPGQRIRVPLRETAAALESEIAEFRAAMETQRRGDAEEGGAL